MDVANDFVFQLLQLAHDEIERQRRQQQVNSYSLIQFTIGPRQGRRYINQMSLC